jgi:Protein of unknown function DUF262
LESTLSATRTVYTVNQYLDWQRHGALNLNPIFQRRPVWKAPAKSQLIDSVVRGYPLPIILLRQVQDLKTLKINMEVVDGQQRLRTLLSFIDPACLSDFDPLTDTFTVRPSHNADIAGKAFASLPTEVKRSLLGYEISTHIFPATTGDELIFRIFARLNSTGLSLNEQEIRNSEFHGSFKTLVYELAFENLDRWRKWQVFPNNAISRMDEAEGVSEYLLAMVEGITGKSQAKISAFYRLHEDEYADAAVVRQRFDATLGAIDKHLGKLVAASAFRRPALFYSLFTALYDHMYGLASRMRRRRPRLLPKRIANAFHVASERIRAKNLPLKVQDAMDKATADKARRDQRHKFLLRALNLDTAS